MGPEVIQLGGRKAPPGYIEPSGSGWGVPRYALRADKWRESQVRAEQMRRDAERRTVLVGQGAIDEFMDSL